MSYSSAFYSDSYKYQFLTLCPRGHQKVAKSLKHSCVHRPSALLIYQLNQLIYSSEVTLMYWESGKSSLCNKELRFWYKVFIQ